jgi:hypothetical protein
MDTGNSLSKYRYICTVYICTEGLNPAANKNNWRKLTRYSHITELGCFINDSQEALSPVPALSKGIVFLIKVRTLSKLMKQQHLFTFKNKLIRYDTVQTITTICPYSTSTDTVHF